MKGRILVSGASRGLGHELVKKYLELGYEVFACVRSLGKEQFGELKERFGDALQVVVMDVASTESVESAAGMVKSKTPELDMIINNAAIYPEGGLKVLEELDVDNFNKTYNINTLGALRVAKEFAGLLGKGSMKTLVNISSEAGSIGSCNREKEFDYCMSKAALNMESVILQNYLGKRDIKVLALHPGWIRSDMGGPEADLSVEEAAGYVMGVVDRYRKDLGGPIYLDYKGSILKY